MALYPCDNSFGVGQFGVLTPPSTLLSVSGRIATAPRPSSAPDSVPGDIAITPTSEAPTSSTECPNSSTEVGGERRLPRKRKRGNKNAPVSYPPGLKNLIDLGLVVWGQRFPEIRAFDPSRGVGRGLYFSVIHLATSETRPVSQAQAFSGRDEEIEEWGSRMLQAMLHSPPPAALPFQPSPSTTGNVQDGTYMDVQNAIAADFHVPFWDDITPWANCRPAPSSQPRSSPLLSDLDSISAAGYYTEDGTGPPPSRASTSSTHEVSSFDSFLPLFPHAARTDSPNMGTYPDYISPPSPAYAFVASQAPTSASYWPYAPLNTPPPSQTSPFLSAPSFTATGSSMQYFPGSQRNY